jgi:NADH:ubiquinone oxidoreductase subunit F (NADH-binding)
MAGGVRDGRKLKAVIPGGSSVPVVPAIVMLDLNMDYDSISKAGSMLGSGAVIVMDETTDMVKVLQRISRFYYLGVLRPMHPVPGRHGLALPDAHPHRRGTGRPEDLDLKLDDVASKIEGGRSARSAMPRPCRCAASSSISARVRLLHRAQALHGRRGASRLARASRPAAEPASGCAGR